MPGQEIKWRRESEIMGQIRSKDQVWREMKTEKEA